MESFIIDKDRKAIEHAKAAAKPALVYDNAGNPSVMVVIPKFNLEDVEPSDIGTGTLSFYCPAKSSGGNYDF